MKQREVLTLAQNMQRVPEYVLDAKDETVKFRYAFLKNFKSLRAEIDTISEVYKDRLKPVVDALRAKDPEGEAKPLSGITICGLIHVPISLTQEETAKLMDEVLSADEFKPVLDAVNDDLEKNDSDWVPHKVALDAVPSGFTTSMLEQMDVLIREV